MVKELFQKIGKIITVAFLICVFMCQYLVVFEVYCSSIELQEKIDGLIAFMCMDMVQTMVDSKKVII